MNLHVVCHRAQLISQSCPIGRGCPLRGKLFFQIVRAQHWDERAQLMICRVHLGAQLGERDSAQAFALAAIKIRVRRCVRRREAFAFLVRLDMTQVQIEIGEYMSEHVFQIPLWIYHPIEIGCPQSCNHFIPFIVREVDSCFKRKSLLGVVQFGGDSFPGTNRNESFAPVFSGDFVIRSYSFIGTEGFNLFLPFMLKTLQRAPRPRCYKQQTMGRWPLALAVSCQISFTMKSYNRTYVRVN